MEENLQSPEPRAAPVDETPCAAPDVAALTRRMAEGDEAAWRIFYGVYFDRLWRYLLVVTAGNEDAAREALQGAMIRAARHVKPFRCEAALWSWLTVLARSALADESKKRRRYFSFLDRFTSHSKMEAAGANDGEAGGRLRHLLEQKIASLPADERELIAQKYFSRRAVRDIAAEWQTTEKAVESKLSRVRRKLKEAVLAGLKNEQQRG